MIQDEATYTSTATGRMTRTRYTVLTLILLLATVAYADRSILSIAGPSLVKEFGLSSQFLRKTAHGP
jgi:ACS family glucarate transporter-like MFS transporter